MRQAVKEKILEALPKGITLRRDNLYGYLNIKSTT